MMQKIFAWIKGHKIWTGLGIIVVIGAVFFIYRGLTGTKAETRYVLASATKGTIITSVTGTGQVTVSDQLDVYPQVSGTIIGVQATVGQTVKTGDLLAQINATDALKAVRDAKVSLDSAQISLQKLQQPPDSYSVLQSTDAINTALQDKQTAQDNLAKAYDDGFNSVANAFLDLPGVETGLNDILLGNELSSSQANVDYVRDRIYNFDNTNTTAQTYRDDAYNSYETSHNNYTTNFNDYKAITRLSDNTAIFNLITETYSTTKEIADAVKNANNILQLYQDTMTQHNLKTESVIATQLTSLNNYTNTVNSHLTDLLNAKTTITNDQQAITDADQTINEKTAALNQLQAGTDPLDIKNQQVSILQRQNALTDAYDQLAKYSVRAPIDGKIAKVNVMTGDTASSGTSVATIITNQQIAQISLNEVDAAKISLGQKATMTFDAVPDVTITGKVIYIDTVGTVSQGVVTYTVKIAFDTPDPDVKPGMSVSASIITNVKQDVLTVPNAAIKASGATNYVEMPNESVSPDAVNNTNGIVLTQPVKQQPVQIGLANDTSTEITSGLNEGDLVITRTINSNTASATTSSNSLFNLGGGGNRGFGGGTTIRTTTPTGR